MAIKTLQATDRPPQTSDNAGNIAGRGGATYEDDLTQIRLRDALAREDALLRERDGLIQRLVAWREAAARHVAGLTQRERQIMEMILAGHPNKNIAADLNISQRTVENHRAAVMKKTGSKSLPALARLALVAAWNDVAVCRPQVGSWTTGHLDREPAAQPPDSGCQSAMVPLDAPGHGPAVRPAPVHDRTVVVSLLIHQMTDEAHRAPFSRYQSGVATNK